MGRPGHNAPPKDGQLMDAAMSLFLQHGVGHTSIDQICKFAGISKATFYRHFDNKEEILTILVKRQVENTVLLPPDNGTSQPPEIVLREFANKMVALFSKKTTTKFYQMIISESLRDPKLGQMFFLQITQAGLLALEAYLAEQIKLGVLTIENPKLAAFQFMGLFKETLFWPRLFGMTHAQIGLDREETIEQAAQIFLSAYRAR